ncbi:MAG: hypothetical protein [Cressdnaviricota sp.]|nr:MAG: hypothetical protein [Cressdnaviricota sp.]
MPAAYGRKTRAHTPNVASVVIDTSSSILTGNEGYVFESGIFAPSELELNGSRFASTNFGSLRGPRGIRRATIRRRRRVGKARRVRRAGARRVRLRYTVLTDPASAVVRAILVIPTLLIHLRVSSYILE